MISLGTRRRPLRLLLAILSLAAFLQTASAQISLPLPLGCGWPFKTTPDTLNVMYPDANAIYWTTPFITLQGSELTINGNFFPARFLSINTYNTLGESINSVYDKNFPVDTGSQNPFSNESAAGGSFHIMIKPAPQPFDINNPPTPPAGTLYGPPVNQFGFSQGYVVIRAYIPINGDVPQNQLPNITIALNNLKLGTVPPCTTLSNSLRLLLYNALIRYWDGNYNAPGETDPPDQPMFRPPSTTQAGGAFPNDFNKYIVTGMTYQGGRLVVIRGKAPVVPDTNSYGYPILGTEQLRYWSLCNYDHVFPYPVVKDGGCAADNATHLDSSHYYTYVIAATADIPKYKDPNVTLINWGSTVLSKAVLFRNMLPVNGFTQTAQTANAPGSGCTTGVVVDDATCTKNIMGDYYPKAVYCAKSVYEQGGWQACFQQAATVRKQE
jgi:hypothetical protein